MEENSEAMAQLLTTIVPLLQKILRLLAPLRPKNGVNGYTLYRRRVKGQNAKKWNELSDGEKAEWTRKAKEVRNSSSSSSSSSQDGGRKRKSPSSEIGTHTTFSSSDEDDEEDDKRDDTKKKKKKKKSNKKKKKSKR